MTHILDALDETLVGADEQESDQSYCRALSAIMEVVDGYHLTPVVVTVRKAGYQNHNPAKLTGFHELKVLDFQFTDIRSVIRR